MVLAEDSGRVVSTALSDVKSGDGPGFSSGRRRFTALDARAPRIRDQARVGRDGPLYHLELAALVGAPRFTCE